MAATTKEALLRVQPREGLTSSNQDRKQNMTTVPTTAVDVEAPTDFRGFRVLPRFDPAVRVALHEREERVEKALLTVIYNPELRVLYVQLYEGMTTREHLWATLLVKGLVQGDVRPCSWARCTRDGQATDCLAAELSYSVDAHTDAEFDRLVARYYGIADGCGE
jgi:hypothetical protein